MKDKVRAALQKTAAAPVIKQIIAVFRALWGIISHNIGLKILSLFMAVLLWNYVISNNTELTRTKVVSGLTGVVTASESAMSRLALLDDPTEALSNVSVAVEVKQAEFAYVNAANVQVTLDLNGVRTEGTQEVRLSAKSAYGRVVKVYPETLTLRFELRDSRELPITTVPVGDISDDLWVNIVRTNPTSLTVSGATTLVNRIDRVQVETDLTGEKHSFTAAEHYVLLDGDGNEIDQTMLTLSSSSVSVVTDIYPKREIKIADDISSVVTGTPAEGYVVESVTIQPDTLTVAGESELINAVNALYIKPVNVDGLMRSVSVKMPVAALSSFKYVSAEDVYVTINIAEETEGIWLDDVNVTFLNMDPNLSLVCEDKTIRVYVTGPISMVEEIRESGLVATIDLTDKKAGTYTEAPQLQTEMWQGAVFTPESSGIEYTLTEEQEDTNNGG